MSKASGPAGGEVLGVLLGWLAADFMTPRCHGGIGWPVCSLSQAWGAPSSPSPPLSFPFSSAQRSPCACPAEPPCPRPGPAAAAETGPLDSEASGVIANWGEKGPDCLAGGRAAWAAERAGRWPASPSSCRRPLAHYVSPGAGAGAERARGAGRGTARGSDNAAIVARERGLFGMNGARAS